MMLKFVTEQEGEKGLSKCVDANGQPNHWTSKWLSTAAEKNTICSQAENQSHSCAILGAQPQI